jgi:FeS assembly SUF system protein
MTERIIPLADVPPADGGSREPELPSSGFTIDPERTSALKPQIVEAISRVFDPEIPVNIYELGLIYDIEADAASNVVVRMTLTAPACPSAQTIPVDVERQVRQVPGIGDVKVLVVWDPPWTRERMSDAARLTLGMY